MIYEYICEKVSYNYFFDIKKKYKPREWNKGAQRWQNFDLMCKVGRLNIPPFDGSAKSRAKAWVHELDTYLQFNPMTNEEAI